MQYLGESGLIAVVYLTFVLVGSSDQAVPPPPVPDHLHRKSRAVHEIFLSDPLDCLSQLVCGLNTFPPQVPTPRTSSANDYAYLLQHVILRLKKQTIKPTQPPPQPSTSSTTSRPVVEEESVEDDDHQDDADSEEDEDTTAEQHRKKLLKNSKDQNGDIVEMKGLYPPLGIIDFYKKGRAMKENSKTRAQGRAGKKSKKSHKKPQKQAPSIQKPLTQLELLKREQDIRIKLRSNAQCLYGILDHTCPFRYSELLILMGGVLERQKVISYSSSKILPMVGYLLKSRSLTQTMKATFFALERINNITIARNINNQLPSFSHVYDEIVRGTEFGGNGLHIVETKIDAPASSQVYEDDEFDSALKNPFLPRDKIPGYAIKNRSKNKKKTSKEEGVDNSAEDEEDGAEFIIPPHSADPFTIGDLAGFLNRPEQDPEYYDENESDNGAESQEDVPLPPVYGLEGTYKPKKGNK